MSSLEEQNSRKISKLADAVEALIEVKRTNKALKAREMQKSQDNREGLEKLEEEVERIGKQSGVDIEIGKSETEKEVTEKMAFWTSAAQRGTRYAEGWR